MANPGRKQEHLQLVVNNPDPKPPPPDAQGLFGEVTEDQTPQIPPMQTIVMPTIPQQVNNTSQNTPSGDNNGIVVVVITLALSIFLFLGYFGLTNFRDHLKSRDEIAQKRLEAMRPNKFGCLGDERPGFRANDTESVCAKPNDPHIVRWPN